MHTADHRVEYRTISARAKRLLTLQEDFDVDFKASSGGLKSEDLVAFANSETGGSILIGVDENVGSDGRQAPTISGCRVGDREKLSLLSKANSCTPPVQADVIVENCARKPFFRIEIPSGGHKPYCTSGGTYKIRTNGGSAPLTPTLLLEMYLRAEGDKFLQTFTESTAEVESQLSDLQRALRDWGVDMEGTLRDISGHAETAGMASEEGRDLADEAASKIDGLDHKIDRVPEAVDTIDARLYSLVKHLGVEDPVTKGWFMLAAVNHLSNNPGDEDGLQTLASKVAK